MRTRPMILCCFVACLVVSAPCLRAADDKMIVGADISMLPEIEKAGGVFLDNGKPSDAIAIFRNHGFNLFRVRLFVNPSKDFNSNWGAVQDFETVRALAKRIKASGAMLLLDLHYSDTWAVMAFEGGLDYFIHAVFNYPTLSDAYKYAAYDALKEFNKLPAGTVA